MSSLLRLCAWNLRRQRTQLLALSLAIAAFVGLLVALSEVIQPAQLEQVYKSLPKQLIALVGLRDGFTIDQGFWLTVLHNHPLWLILALSFPITSALQGFASRAEDGSLELYLALPVSRRRYFLAVALTVVVGNTVIIAASSGAALVAVRIFAVEQPAAAGQVLALGVSGWSLALAVGGLSLLCAVATAGRGRPGMLTLGMVVGLYFVRYLAQIWPAFAPFGPLSIFFQHDPSRILAEGLSLPKLGVLIGFAAVCGTLGGLWFTRREWRF